MRLLALGLVLLALIVGIARAGEPAPDRGDRGPERFSLSRALAVRRRVLASGGASAHALGMQSHGLVRDAFVRELRALEGAVVETRARWVCSPHGNCARVENVFARISPVHSSMPLEGALLVAAHYDSVPAGPGVSDDLGPACVAVELARALRVATGARRAIFVLLTDGEEAGLLGMRAFVDDDREVRDVRAVVNLEARGTHGAALLFETGVLDAVVPTYAAHAARPATSSALVSAYRAMPNDTDYSLLRDRRIPGANFAFLEGGARYHTPLDDAAHASDGSLSQMGDTAYFVARGFLTGPVVGTASAHWLDLAGTWVLSLRASATRLLAGLALASLVAVLLFARRRRALRSLARVAWISLAQLGALALALVASALVALVARMLGGHPAPFVAHVLPTVLTAAGLAVLAVLGLAQTRPVRHAGAFERLASAWLTLGSIGFLLAVVLPGTALLVVLPAALFAASALLALALHRPRAAAHTLIAAATPAGAALALTLAPALRLLPELLGVLFVPAYALLPWMLAVASAPLLAPRWARRARLGLVLSALVLVPAMVFAPAFTVDAPQRCSLSRVRDHDRGRTVYAVDTSFGGFAFGGLPVGLRRAFPGLEGSRERLYPWSYVPAWVQPTLDVSEALPPPVVDVERAGPARRLHLRSPRGAPWMALWFDPADAARVRSITVEGAVVPTSTRDRPVNLLRVHTVPPEGVHIELVLDRDDPRPLPARVLDESPGLTGPDAPAWLRARGSRAAPSQQGDTTAVTRVVEL